uniref:alpha-L-fucosidase n=1 Tax=Chromera velia CCMP2878 TaxID=1169474 RepID=A0A0G4I4K0_9ALVE|eukprot:Cvel_10922.t1-p1 / transcript=Cvel_10922.t1 / gene=Cvel_10922 / organism=Chromera_velia_CCMP2878 / gene_product=Putative alpha-L-fucosidase 1, putative / transcript_product=Putative alpha-L-fucosidase 1, putative / location=Cvel_scaffold671:24114-25670(+) / protein_length=519 / sequence_SO=supercontig / SO=protein_coding / is_pseudo=false
MLGCELSEPQPSRCQWVEEHVTSPKYSVIYSVGFPTIACRAETETETAIMFGVFGCALAALLPLSIGASLPRPTQEHLRWHKDEFACFIHWNMATAAGIQGCPCDKEPPPVSQWNPKALNTDAWISAGVSMGCKRFVLTAKHGCGFLLWDSKTEYPYTVANAANTTDVVSEFVKSAKKFGVGYGFYYSTVTNAYARVCDSKVSPGSSKYPQEEFDRLVLSHLSELWGNYGDLDEIWFDGGYNKNLTADLRTLLSNLQPHTVGFQARGIMPSPIRWVGNEAGDAPYPTWSTVDPSAGGAANGSLWEPAESDFTLQKGDLWFFSPGAPVHSPRELRQMYERTAGHNAGIIVDFAPDPSGQIPLEQLKAAESLGTYLKECYGQPAASSIPFSRVTAVTIFLDEPTKIDRLMLREDQTEGQLIRKFRLSAVVEKGEAGQSVELFEGSAIGNKFIFVIDPPVKASSVTISEIEVDPLAPPGAPHIDTFAVFSGCNEVADRLDQEWEYLKKGEEESAERFTEFLA